MPQMPLFFVFSVCIVLQNSKCLNFITDSDGPNHWEATGISSSPPADVSWKVKAKKLNGFMSLILSSFHTISEIASAEGYEQMKPNETK